MIIFKKTQNIPRLPLTNIIKFWEREYSVFTISTWTKMLELINSEKWGENSFNIFLCFYLKNKSYHYRNIVEEEKFEKIIALKLFANNEFLEEMLNFHTSYATKLFVYFKKIEQQNNFSINFIKEFADLFGNFAASNTCIQRSADFVAKAPNQQKILNKLIKQRTKYEYVMAHFEKYYEIICNKIIKINKIKLIYLKLMTVEEVVAFLEEKKLPDDIKEREKAVAILILPKPMILSGKIALDFFKKVESITDIKKTETIFGSGIYGKKIVGKAQVITNPIDFKKIKKGHILVTYTTLPQYNLFLKKTAGIITDEGGILTHPAVFCREFKIPGIVGTKNATKIIKNNQLIELDPTTGSIKIIK